MIENISTLFFRSAMEHPMQIAIQEKNASVSFSELNLLVQRTAMHFKRNGIGKGDRVLVFVPMSIDLYRIVLALYQVGATAVFLDEWVSKERMELCCRIAECKGFIAPFKIRMLSVLSKTLRQLPVHLSSSAMSRETLKDVAQVEKEDIGLITFTTGSTGTPKAAIRTHEFLKAQFDALMPLLLNNQIETDMPMLPIVLFLNLGIGRTSVIADYKAGKPELFNPMKVLEQIRQFKVEQLIGSPAYLLKLANANNPLVPSLKRIISGGAPVFPEDAKALLQAFPSVDITIAYGSTEAEPISTIGAHELISLEENVSDGLCVGKPDEGIQLNIIRISDKSLFELSSEEFDSMNLSEGMVGEIVVTGPHVLNSYLNNPEAVRNNKIWVDRERIWHRTGDAGSLRNGKLYLYGRCKQIIQWNNHTWYPFIIESRLRDLAKGKIGTLILLKNRPVMVIELVSKSEISEIRAGFMREGYPMEDIEFKRVDKIPRDPRHQSKMDYENLAVKFR